MKKDNHIIVAIHITDRVKKAPKIQEILSQYGCHIKTRLGLNEASPEFCSPNGLVLLEMLDEPKTVKALRDQLAKLAGVETKALVFRH